MHADAIECLAAPSGADEARPAVGDRARQEAAPSRRAPSLALPPAHRLGCAAIALVVSLGVLHIVTGLGAPARSHTIAAAMLQRSPASPALAMARPAAVAVASIHTGKLP